MSELLDATDADDQTAEVRRRGAAVSPIRPTDGERLMRFCRYRDEAAFAEVVEIHAALVWGVCSQVLRHRQDVEDAFQATFLILARKAKSIRACESAAGWLYRVAFRTALLARNRRGRRAAEPLYDEPVSDDDQFEAIARNDSAACCSRSCTRCRCNTASPWCCAIWRVGREAKQPTSWA